MRIVRRRPRLSVLLLASLALGGASLHSATTSARIAGQPAILPEPRGDVSILTYNVKGLPWPVATGRTKMLDAIGRRLSQMRDRGRQPAIVVLQEAFTQDARRIAEMAGYRYVVLGPSVEHAQDRSAQGAWYLGETQGPLLDSGLMLLSDYPVESVHRAAFPDGACAGFDCLAAKGVLLVTVSLPGKGRIAIANTHFNSRGASRAPAADTARAYARQAGFLAEFIARHWQGDMPLVIAGDFNRGQRPYRMQVLPQAFARIGGGDPPADGLGDSLAARAVPASQLADARHIASRARDMQFVLPSSAARLDPVGASVPFGSEGGAGGLSDHHGFTVDYRIGT